MVFNTLQYAKKLEEVGIPINQAEAHVQLIAEIIEGDLAAKQDLEYRLVIKLGAIVLTTMTFAMALTTWLMKVH